MIKMRLLLLEVEDAYADPKRWEMLNKLWRPEEGTEKLQFKDYTLVHFPCAYDEYSNIGAFDASRQYVGGLFYGKPHKESYHIEGAIEIHPDHRRKGIASEMYKWAEKLSGLTIHPSYPHTAAASKFWNQANIGFGPMKPTSL